MTAALPSVDVLGIGLLGPGLPGWEAGAPRLRDPAAWCGEPTVVPAPARLPPAERRRAGTLVKLAIGVAEQALAHAGLDPRSVATVFAASSGDGVNCHALCEALATPERLVSPTRFTNSVHNAAAGYWHIATASRAPSTSLCSHDASFGAGLLEAVSQCLAGGRPVLLVAADAPYPEPLHQARPLPDAFACAFLLAPAGSGKAFGRVALEIGRGDADRLPVPRLEALRAAIPAARGLGLLTALAHGEARSVAIDLPPGLVLRIALEGPAR